MHDPTRVESTADGPIRLFQALIREFAGPGATHPVLRTPLNGVEIGSIAAVLASALVLSLVVVLTGHLLAGRPKAHHAASALSRPAQVLLWGYASYLVASTLLQHLAPADAALIFQDAVDAIARVGAFVVLIWLISRLTRVLEVRLVGWASHTQTRLDDLLLPFVGSSLRLMAVVLAVIFTLPILELPERYAALASRGTSVLLIGATAVILFRMVRVGEQELLRRYDIAATDNLRARKVYTQVRVIGRVIDVAIGLFSVAAVLMMFSEVRQLGASLLASAGVVGIVAGIAAQKTIGNLFAGFQIAMAQPMRQDDVVVVEGEWGRIEEITLTYVVIHIWDDRRLIVPLSYFIEKPFANWTRTSSQILGQVTLWVDYGFPVEEGRRVVKEIIEASPLWDRRFWNLQVVDSSEKSMQLRVLATAASSSISFDLRCEIREKFIAAIQSRWPQALPQLRIHQ